MNIFFYLCGALAKIKLIIISALTNLPGGNVLAKGSPKQNRWMKELREEECRVIFVES